MFQRFIRAIKSLFGGVVSSMENPKLILEQNIRELNDQIPEMNENIATVKANLIMLRKEAERGTKNVQELTHKIKSAIQANRDDIAEGYALQFEKAKADLASTQTQLEFAEKAYEKALKVKEIFMREKDRKIQEAKEALRASERSEWQAKIADTLEQFEVGGIDQTHDEMINRINEEAAKNEARMEIALDSLDTQTMEIEANAEKLRAHALVEQFKLEMNPGLNQAETSQNLEQDLSTTSEEAPVDDPAAEETKVKKKSIGSKVKLLKDTDSHTDYERVKNEWKEHYEQIRLLKKQHKTAQKTQNINRALSNMQGALNRLGIENFTNTQISGPTQAVSVESSQEALESKAKQSLDIIAAEMGIMNKNKDTRENEDSTSQAFQEVSTLTYSKKTIGKKA